MGLAGLTARSPVAIAEHGTRRVTPTSAGLSTKLAIRGAIGAGSAAVSGNNRRGPTGRSAPHGSWGSAPNNPDLWAAVVQAVPRCGCWTPGGAVTR